MAILNPTISIILKYSFKNTKAIIAEVGGIKKKRVTVLLAEPLCNRYINIEKAPKETKKNLVAYSSYESKIKNYE